MITRFVVVIFVSACSTESTATPCVTAADCASSAEATAAGRCAPELSCVAGTCRAECLGTCNANASSFVPPACSDGAICSAPEESPTHPSAGALGTEGRCTRRPITCTSSSDCPAYKPGPGTWTCESSVCRFPSFTYERD